MESTIVAKNVYKARKNMTWAVIEGVCQDGQILLKEKIPIQGMIDILVLIPERTKPAIDKNSDWKRICQKVMEDTPELLTRSVTERRNAFDRISEKIARNLPYESVEEFERAMRGDQYDLIRY